MNVRLDLPDVADVQLFRRWPHQLHDADGAHRALGLLIQLGFLVPQWAAMSRKSKLYLLL